MAGQVVRRGSWTLWSVLGRGREPDHHCRKGPRQDPYRAESSLSPELLSKNLLTPNRKIASSASFPTRQIPDQIVRAAALLRKNPGAIIGKRSLNDTCFGAASGRGRFFHEGSTLLIRATAERQIRRVLTLTSLLFPLHLIRRKNTKSISCLRGKLSEAIHDIFDADVSFYARLHEQIDGF